MATPTPSPQVLPVSNPQNTITTTVTTAEPQPPQPAFRAVISYFSDSLRHSLSHRRPWPELMDRSALAKPTSFSEATVRVRHNVSYFRVNYYVVVSLILAVSLLTSPFSLVLLFSLLASWLFLYLLRPSDRPLRLFGRTFTDFETLSLLAGSSFFLLFLTPSAPSSSPPSPSPSPSSPPTPPSESPRTFSSTTATPPSPPASSPSSAPRSTSPRRPTRPRPRLIGASLYLHPSMIDSQVCFYVCLMLGNLDRTKNVIIILRLLRKLSIPEITSDDEEAYDEEALHNNCCSLSISLIVHIYVCSF
ncbi:hypothetical protein ACSQ67_016266 [Phaseolus vulgaris]